MDSTWSIDTITDDLFRTKFVTIPDILGEWMGDHGGLAGKDILEFGCGEGTMALGLALRKSPARVVGVEILDVHRNCLNIARTQTGLQSLPAALQLHQIAPGQSLHEFGPFDFAFSWSVFEHVRQDMLETALQSIAAVLRPGGHFFLQIDPLYYSANGSHLMPWVTTPWAHLALQQDLYHSALLAAPPSSPALRHAWSVYISPDADIATERAALWETYVTLNKATAPQLCRLAEQTGFEILRDYRTVDETPIPAALAEIYDTDILKTQQIVLLLRRTG